MSPLASHSENTQPSPRVRAGVDELESLFVEAEGKTMNASKDHRQALARLVHDYGTVVVRPAWRVYLKERDTKRTWAAKQFIDGFPGWLKRAEKYDPTYTKHYWDVRKRVWSFGVPHPEFKTTLAPSELAIVQEHREWKLANRDRDVRQQVTACPLHHAGVLLDIQERQDAWYKLNGERLNREEAEYYEQNLAEIDADPETHRNERERTAIAESETAVKGIFQKEREDIARRKAHVQADQEAAESGIAEMFGNGERTAHDAAKEAYLRQIAAARPPVVEEPGPESL